MLDYVCIRVHSGYKILAVSDPRGRLRLRSAAVASDCCECVPFGVRMLAAYLHYLQTEAASIQTPSFDNFR